jgi:SAM-dependent methyltransferase
LDLGCGTGAVARVFLEAGYRVTGLDLSPAMLAQAERNLQPYLELGQARLVQGDAASFEVDEPFGLVISTYDALNHLPDLDALESCFDSVARALAPGGLLVFDLNTRAGLRRWNSQSVQELEEGIILVRGVFDPQGQRAYTHIAGVWLGEDGHYQRFEETVYNTVFDIAEVLEALRARGWPNPYAASLNLLREPLPDPERSGRVFIVAER